MSKWTVDGFAGTSELGVPIVVLSHPSGSQERCKATSVERVLRSLNREDEFDAIKAERDAALERVRVLSNEVCAYRHPDSKHADKTRHILTLRYSGDTLDELMNARSATDAANALGDGAS